MEYWLLSIDIKIPGAKEVIAVGVCYRFNVDLMYTNSSFPNNCRILTTPTVLGHSIVQVIRKGKLSAEYVTRWGE